MKMLKSLLSSDTNHTAMIVVGILILCLIILKRMWL